MMVLNRSPKEKRRNGPTSNRNRQHPMLVKLHGSTDWYADGQTGHPTKLRHPMPLFGRSVLRLSEKQELGSALVLPSREKLLTKAPYPRLSQTFLNVADCCDLALFVGSSLRDEPIREAARSIVTRAPVFIVDPKGEGHAVEGCRRNFTMRQHFLGFDAAECITYPSSFGCSPTSDRPERCRGAGYPLYRERLARYECRRNPAVPCSR